MPLHSTPWWDIDELETELSTVEHANNIFRRFKILFVVLFVVLFLFLLCDCAWPTQDRCVAEPSQDTPSHVRPTLTAIWHGREITFHRIAPSYLNWGGGAWSLSSAAAVMTVADRDAGLAVTHHGSHAHTRAIPGEYHMWLMTTHEDLGKK
jgi:hypothetical protein